MLTAPRSTGRRPQRTPYARTSRTYANGQQISRRSGPGCMGAGHETGEQVVECGAGALGAVLAAGFEDLLCLVE